MDLLLQGGLVVDGSGAPAYHGDVGIKDGRLVVPPRGKAKETIDCKGKVVCPGWVDLHAHIDAQLTWDQWVHPLAANGVTTVVMGNCGVGFAPCKPKDREFLLELMEGVEDIPLGAMHAGIKWNWETFPEFMDHLATQSFALDVGALVGHGPVRAYVLGKRANITDRPGRPADLSAEELAEVAACVGEAAAAGAMGFSTSRTLLHRDRNGVLVPGTMAGENELFAIAEQMAKNGGGVVEMASDFMSGDDTPWTEENHNERLVHFGREWGWMQRLSLGFGLPVSFCLGVPSQLPAPKSFRNMLRKLQAARSLGCPISAQVLVRPQGILLCWRSKSHPFVESQRFHKLRSSADPAKWLPALLDPAVRKQIVAETQALADGNAGEATFGITLPTQDAGNMNGSLTERGALAKMFVQQAHNVFRWSPTYEPDRSECLRDVAKAKNLTVLEVLYDWLCEEKGNRVVTLLFMNYAIDNADDTIEMLLHSGTVPGLGDAGAHVGFLTDAGAHTHLISYLHRDRKPEKGKRITLEQAVKLHTSDTAEVFGLADRGRLADGLLADINVMDLAKLEMHEPRFVDDLPEGASRWLQTVGGYELTIKRGSVVYRKGEKTGALPGRLLRRPAGSTSYPEATLPGRLRLLMFRLLWFIEHISLVVFVRIFGARRLEALAERFAAAMPLNCRLK